MKRAVAIISTMVILGISGGAQASSTSVIAVGVGSQLGISNYKAANGMANSSVVSEMALRVKLLKFFGLDLTCNLADEQALS